MSHNHKSGVYIIKNLPKKEKTVKSKTKIIKLHHHHAKPYRKRHISLLVFFFVAFLILFVTAVQYRAYIGTSMKSSADFVSDLFSTNNDDDKKIHSNLGFSLSYDQKKFIASGIDAENGDIYTNQSLAQDRNYNTIRIAPTLINSQTSQSTLTLTYHQEISYEAKAMPSLDSINTLALSDALVTADSFEKTQSEEIKINGQKFLKSVWGLKNTDGLTSKLNVKIALYTTIVNNHPVTIAVNYGLGDSSKDTLYQPVISSISFEKKYSLIKQDSNVATRIRTQRTLLDDALFNNLAAAETKSTTSISATERNAALYGPAVVKIYNVYCMDIEVKGVKFIEDACEGMTGSGFFVSQDGYIATNGHVATSDAKDVAISTAVKLYQKGNRTKLEALITLSGIKASDISGMTQEKALATIIDKMYDIPSSVIKKANSVNNLLVALNDKSPDIKKLTEDTQYRVKYNEGSNIKQADLKASDYSQFDYINGFEKSDIAIIKIDGENYPITKLGDIDDAIQGSDLSILGFPSNATENGIVDSLSNIVSLTTGKVSSIKEAAGSRNKVLETTTTIGHGNSGGPAIIDNGTVVGIATYTADGSGTGDGVFNYIRDINDLKNLASKKSITFDTNSKTQTKWEQGIGYFYTAHYSKSLEYFNLVKTLYPNSTRVDEFIAAANKRIENGEDVKDFPILGVSIGAFLALIGIGIAVFFIINHKERHNIYNNQIAQGNIQPINPGTPPQFVSYTTHSGQPTSTIPQYNKNTNPYDQILNQQPISKPFDPENPESQPRL